MNWTVYIRWVIANLLGGIVGYLTAFLLSFIIGGFGLLIGGAIGAVVGLAQWQVLRDYIPDMQGSRWVSFTALGYGVSAQLIAFLGLAMAYTANIEVQGDAVQGFIDLAEARNGLEAILALATSFWSARLGAMLLGALAGAVLGLSQWWVLRRHVQWAALWVPVVAAAGIVGTSAALFTALYVYDGTVNNASILIVGFSVNVAGIFFIGSLITGLALASLEKKGVSG